MKSIIVENVSKKYCLDISKKRIFSNSLREEMWQILNNPLQYINKNKEVEVWALRDINLDIDQGEILGIIGRNGSGKTTLLKILSQITLPTSGKAVLRGKVTSLLDIGIGFQPSFTGRENIYLNGAILGYAQKDIEKQLDNIIDFSGIRKFIDTPVKYYSSGMYVRLAFSIATSLSIKPDILLLDEIFAVGDAQFYKKCVERISSLTNKSETTVLLVSHNLSTIEKLCPRCLWLEKGEIRVIGESKSVISRYLKFTKS